MPNLLVKAGPGCGKTHTISDAYSYKIHGSPQQFVKNFGATSEQVAMYDWVRSTCGSITAKPIYMAYNTNIVESIKKRVHTDCTDNVKTHHGWGYSVIRDKHGYIPLKSNRGELIVQKITGTPLNFLKDKFNWISTLRYVDKLKIELLPVTESNLYLLQQKYSDLAPFKIHSDMCIQAAKLIQEMKVIDFKSGLDYTDQVWLALWLLDSPKYAWGFVDESQDLSPFLLELSKRLCENLIFVGDENQAINAWNGADPEAVNRIQQVCDQTLTLTQSFRLTPEHARHANTIRPSACLKSSPGRQDGVTQTIDPEDTINFLSTIYQHSPMVLSRYNAPLVKLAFRCIKAGIPVKCVGSHVMDGLINTVENRHAGSIKELHSKLDRYELSCLGVGNDMAKEVTKDKFECIRFILDQCKSVSDFKPILESLVKPSKKESKLILSTIHKAKGLENPNIVILNQPVASTKASTTIQKEQEINVTFVAETRSKLNKYYIHN